MPAIDDVHTRVEMFLRARSEDRGSFRLTACEPITGGYSRLMSRVWVEDSGGRRGYVMRADPPPGQSIIDTDRRAEWALLCALWDAGTVPLPAPLFFDPTGDEVGSPAIFTELVPGPSVHSAALTRDRSEHLAMSAQLADVAAAIHTFELGALPPGVAVPPSWDAYIDARIRQWVDAERTYPGGDPFMRMIAAWLPKNKPAPLPLSLVHGDFQPTNAVVDVDGTYRMVDWELAHVGDPREDLGWMVLCGANQPPWLIAEDPETFYERYRKATGFGADEVNPATIAYFTVLGATDVFLGEIVSLAALIRGETSNISVAYTSCAVAAMHNVFMEAIATHTAGTGEDA
ncbi:MULTISPECIES: phosphotransferase family protein [unclassified Pseudofrankia]|uniref:phosphotransferase family protein n=1 Tax=unclassified Pseudofrankia TaxID=2994372 RepID=UPI0008DA30CD|nr:MULTISPECIES: phosphotransferase family protein [unclassified Pseudofrankia]MDT3446904.1 phosphotransferase family protein [Pseudofrankia sp. BMG5.37]OHV49052.1 hypothetical protein BCD48_13270 [Pseudofrankia sp. BMG5.36]